MRNIFLFIFIVEFIIHLLYNAFERTYTLCSEEKRVGVLADGHQCLEEAYPVSEKEIATKGAQQHG
jgi:hypothetical protein